MVSSPESPAPTYHPDDMLNAREAKAVLRVGHDSFNDLIESGQLEAVDNARPGAKQKSITVKYQWILNFWAARKAVKEKRQQRKNRRLPKDFRRFV